MNFEQAKQKLRELDGILQMDISNLYARFVQYRTDVDHLDPDGDYLEEFKILLEEVLTEEMLKSR
jgi:hypothetical protein